MVDYKDHIRQQLLSCVKNPEPFAPQFGTKWNNFPAFKFFHPKDDRDYKVKNDDFKSVCDELGIKYKISVKGIGFGPDETKEHSMYYYTTSMYIRPERMEKELRKRVAQEEHKVRKVNNAIEELNTGITKVKELQENK